VGEEVKDESERNENEEGQEYLFFNIESCPKMRNITV